MREQKKEVEKEVKKGVEETVEKSVVVEVCTMYVHTGVCLVHFEVLGREVLVKGAQRNGKKGD